MFERPEALLLGRRTYEIFAAYWPRRPIRTTRSNGLNTCRSTWRRPDRPVEWESCRAEATWSGAVTELKARDGGELQVHGSANLIQTLNEHGLVDEYNVLMLP